jgi:GTPase SAR1 family protein
MEEIKISLKTYRLRALLKNKSSEKESMELYKRYETLWKFALENYLQFMNIEDFTNHGIDHVLSVEKNVFNLITEEVKNKLTEFDLFCLLAACCLHDIGMIAKKESNEPFLKVREDHHIRTRELLYERFSEFNLNQNEGRIIGEICYGHGISNIDELASYDNWSVAPYGSVNTLLIVSLLRISDLLDLNFLRAPGFVADLKKLKGISRYHWKLHSKVSDIKIDHENRNISIFATAENEYDLSELHKLRNRVEGELTIVDDVFKKNEIFLEKVFLQTNLDKKKVLSKENPFLKLASFDWSKHVAFFGRDKEISDMKDKVFSSKVLVLVGESGVGKTSLLNAGLKQKLIESGVYVFEIRISETFKDDVLKTIKPQFRGFESKDIFKLLEKLTNEGFEMAIFIDQLEELFTLYGHDGTKPKILNFFDKILSNNKISARIILSLREDFLAELWEVSDKIPELYDRRNTYRLKKLNRENAKQTIVNTIKHVNYSIDDDLVEKLLDDFTQQEEGIYPPYIQIVCHEIFRHHKNTYENKSEETPISLAVYEKFSDNNNDNDKKLSGVEKIIADYFEEILDGFSFEERTVIHEILAPMITYFYTKQRITYEQISEINNGRIDIDNTLNRLVNHRIINKIETERDEYELIHDFLAKKILENKPKMGISSKIKKAIDYIEANLKKTLSLQEVANAVGFSREHFCRLFNVIPTFNSKGFPENKVTSKLIARKFERKNSIS